MGISRWDRKLLTDNTVSYPGNGTTTLGAKIDRLELHIDLDKAINEMALFKSGLGSVARFPTDVPAALASWANRCRSQEVANTINVLATGIVSDGIAPSSCWRFAVLEKDQVFEIRLILDSTKIVQNASAQDKQAVTDGLANDNKFPAAIQVIAKYLGQVPNTADYPGAAAVVKAIFLIP